MTRRKTSIFSFFHNALKSSEFQGHYNSGLCGKELTAVMTFEAPSENAL